jgi:hypothetical protein
MRAGRTKTLLATGAAHALSLLVLLAFALRVALPAGTMLEQDGKESAPRIVLCTTAGMVEIADGSDFGVPVQKDGGTPEQRPAVEPCLYAANAVPLASPPPALPPRPLATFVPSAGLAPEGQQTAPRLLAPPPPSTGPPVSA